MASLLTAGVANDFFASFTVADNSGTAFASGGALVLLCMEGSCLVGKGSVPGSVSRRCSYSSFTSDSKKEEKLNQAL